MSNEYKDWIAERYADVVLDAGAIDKVLYTIYLDNWYAVVHGIKDGIHVKYNVWFDDEDGWNYERSEE